VRPEELVDFAAFDAADPHLFMRLSMIFHICGNVAMSLETQRDALKRSALYRLAPSASPASPSLRLLAIADDTPSPVFPGTPTMAATVPGLEVVGWFGLCGRRDIPAPALARWVEAMRRVLADPATRDRLTQGGLTPLFEDPATLGARIARDRTRWKQVIEAVQVRAE
jgi:hypothetical protein